MSKMITGAEYPLGKVFSDDFEYHIPSTSDHMLGLPKRPACSSQT